MKKYKTPVARFATINYNDLLAASEDYPTYDAPIKEGDNTDTGFDGDGDSEGWID